MAHRIEVYFKKEIRDAKGESLRKRIKEDLSIPLRGVRVINVYTIDANFSEKQLKILGESLFADPISQEFGVDESLAKDCDWLLEVGFKPGVTDNVGKTAKEAIEDVLKERFKPNEAVYTSKQYLISGKGLKRGNLDNIAKNLLANDLIQQWLITDYKSFTRKNYYLSIPKVKIPHKPTIATINLNVSNEGLSRISKERKLALNSREMQKIKNYFSRPEIIKERQKFGLDKEPTDAELEALAQTWSEHCKHKIFNAKIKYKNEEG